MAVRLGDEVEVWSLKMPSAERIANLGEERAERSVVSVLSPCLTRRRRSPSKREWRANRKASIGREIGGER